MRYSADYRELLQKLELRTDPTALRVRELLAHRDLTRKRWSPVRSVTEAILALDILREAENVEFPEIVTVQQNFDLLGTPAEHPSRSPSDTFYLDDTYVLRTHTTAVWSYYLTDPRVRSRLIQTGELTVCTYGKVYRNDEINRSTYPVFHQIDVLRLSESSRTRYTPDDPARVLVDIAKAVYNPDVEWKVREDSFPFTDPSIQLEIRWKDQWLDLAGAGIVRGNVLELLGIDPERYNGWAFGFGIDRLAMLKMSIPDIRILWSDDERVKHQFASVDSTYHAVSKYPPVDRDVSFVVTREVTLDGFHALVTQALPEKNREMVEEVHLVDSYKNEEKFGPDRTSYTFRVRYRLMERTLTNEEVNEVQGLVRQAVVDVLGGELR